VSRKRKPDPAHIAQLEHEDGLDNEQFIADLDAELDKGRPPRRRREPFVPPDLAKLKSGPLLTTWASSRSSYQIPIQQVFPTDYVQVMKADFADLSPPKRVIIP
jgi:hypothetical protein